MSTVSALGRRDAIDGVAAALMIAITLSWGLNGVAVKLASTGYSPIFLIFLRSAIGGALVLLWCRLRGIRLFERDGTFWPGTLVGLLFGVEFILVFNGLEHTTVARSTLLMNTMPFWVLLAGHFLLGERMSLRKTMGIALSFSALLLVFSDEMSQLGPDTLIGDVMSLAAGIFWAATHIVIKRSRLSFISAEKLLLYQLVTATVLAAFLLPTSGPLIRDISAVATGALLFQSVYIVAGTYMLWFWLVQRYPASGLASFTFLTPVFAVLFGGLILGEPLGVPIFVAMGLIVGGLLLVNHSPRKQIPIGQ